jgi:hypothetical protein
MKKHRINKKELMKLSGGGNHLKNLNSDSFKLIYVPEREQNPLRLLIMT